MGRNRNKNQSGESGLAVERAVSEVVDRKQVMGE